MIPTIETICENVKTGTITVQQAIAWLYIHAQDGGAELRDGFAMAAMQGMLAKSEQRGLSRVATAAYEAADEMLKARQAPVAA